jgi:hypothetical protein
MDLQILVNGPNWMLPDRDVDWSIGGKDKYGRLSISPRNARECVHRCNITPMQVFENNHPRSFGSQALHEITEFAKHAFPCGSEDFLVECSAILSAQKIRHLRQPCWRVFAKRLKQGRSIGSAALFVQRLDQRQESLMGSEQFVATTVQHAHPVLLHPLRRHLDKCRLAYPGLTGNENDLTVSAQGLLQHAFQNPQGNGPSDPPASALIDRIVRNGCLLLERMLDIGLANRVDGGNEPISAPRYGLNVIGRQPVVAQRGAKRVHGHGQARLAYVEVGPDGVEQFVLSYQFSGAFDQTAQQLERLRRQHDTVLSSPKQGVGPIKPKLTKGKLACSHGCDPHSPDTCRS